MFRTKSRCVNREKEMHHRNVAEEMIEPDEVKNATSQYISENNPVNRWLADRYTITNNLEDRISVEELYRSFVEDSADHRLVSKKKFGGYMGLLGYKSRHSTNIRYYQGIILKQLIYEEDN